MISSEQAFDMLPSVVDIYEKLNLDEYRKELAENNKGNVKDKMAIGIQVFKYIFKNSGKVKQEVFEIVAIFDGKTVEEIKKQSFIKTILVFKEILSDQESMDFFKKAVQ